MINPQKQVLKDRITKHLSKEKMIHALRWFMSTGFFFLALIKTQGMMREGLAPYREFVEVINWPLDLQYYGLFALLVEFYTAVALWNKRLLFGGAVLMAGLVTSGLTLSIYSLIFKINSECGCGLLGQNEYGLIAQKIGILYALFLLSKNKTTLFP